MGKILQKTFRHTDRFLDRIRYILTGWMWWVNFENKDQVILGQANEYFRLIETKT